ncbi:MAG TPA: SDR family oxidoreductase [Bryobacteraceae bacterium]|jgi:3-oxoacyl-[acyl-carrier protein] reductase|nr:SDR family oxidoreductase [Bryobacteraceae bacterium]
MNLGLTNKVAMVAGASRGLGYAVARALAEEGAQVSIASRNADAVAAAGRKIEEETGARVLAVGTDVSSAQAIDHWHEKTIERFGGIDLLFTNSGGPPPGATLSFDDAAWQKAFELLLMSAVRMVRLVVPSMAARGGGSIVLPTSSSVKEPIANLALSNILRASVASLSKTLANELVGQKIRVNHLIPGRISTDRLRELDEANSKRAGISIEEQQKKMLQTIPMARYGDPKEFANAAVFLLSDAASYITGATLQADGGAMRSVL